MAAYCKVQMRVTLPYGTIMHDGELASCSWPGHCCNMETHQVRGAVDTGKWDLQSDGWCTFVSTYASETLPSLQARLRFTRFELQGR